MWKDWIKSRNRGFQGCRDGTEGLSKDFNMLIGKIIPLVKCIRDKFVGVTTEYRRFVVYTQGIVSYPLGNTKSEVEKSVEDSDGVIMALVIVINSKGLVWCQNVNIRKRVL